MMHIILGLFLVALGIWGIFDEWYYVLDCLKAGGSLTLLVGGFVAMLAGVLGRRPEEAPEDLEDWDGAPEPRRPARPRSHDDGRAYGEDRL